MSRIEGTVLEEFVAPEHLGDRPKIATDHYWQHHSQVGLDEQMAVEFLLRGLSGAFMLVPQGRFPCLSQCPSSTLWLAAMSAAIT